MKIQTDVRIVVVILCVVPFHGGLAFGKTVVGDKSDLTTPREVGDLLVNGAKTPGLCSEENRGETQVQQGWCKTIVETMLSESSCTSKLLDKLAGKSAKDIEGMGEFCPAFGKASRDKTQLAMVVRNMLASLVKKESEWKPKVKSGRSKGLLMIAVENASDPRYKCACSGINEKTVYDPHLNLKCGTHIYLVNLLEEMSLGGGGGRKPRWGVAKFFGPYGNSQQKKRNAMARESRAFCTARFGPDDGNVSAGNITAPSSNVTISAQK